MPAEPRHFAGQHAIITGASRGIGAAIAAALARDGASLTLIGRSEPHLADEAAGLREAFRVNVEALRADVTRDDQLEAAFATATQRLGNAHILVNNAGIAEGAPVVQMTRELWDRTLATNLTAAFVGTRLVLPAMIEAGSGRIINMASTAGLHGVARVSAYAASKHGLVGFTRSVALEVAHQGITVNAVCPGYVDTDMARRAVDAVMTGTGRSAAEAIRAITRSSALNRLLAPAEVADIVAWLCTTAAATITGQAITVG
jgi:NAD(P)-dependent dehydrogenase (short-subunit alcohol dehydrogenase family)